MSASWPLSKKTFTQVVDGINKVIALLWNTNYDEVEAMQTWIGTPGAAQSHNAAMLDMITGYCLGGRVYKKDNDEISVGSFRGVISNAAGSVKKFRVKTAVTTLIASNIDTGAFLANTYYYIYATADSASTEPVFVISASSSAPTGYTYYLQIGWFFNESAGVLDITKGFIANTRDGGNSPNCVKIFVDSDVTMTSNAFADLDSMSIPFVSSGRPLKITGGSLGHPGTNNIAVQLEVEIDATEKPESIGGAIGTADAGTRAVLSTTTYLANEIAAGEHTIKLKWRSGSDGYAVTSEQRYLIVEEL